jgi:hypothetical protein
MPEALPPWEFWQVFGPEFSHSSLPRPSAIVPAARSSLSSGDTSISPALAWCCIVSKSTFDDAGNA